MKKGGATKKRLACSQGIAYVIATFNNTIVSICDPNGNVLVQSSAGRHAKGSRKSTAHAAGVAAGEAAQKAVQLYSMKELEVRVNGPGSGRETAIRSLAAAGIMISAIKDITPIPHNGCRAPKRRRV